MTSSLRLDLKALKAAGGLKLSEEIAAGDFQECLPGEALLKGPVAVELTFSVKEGLVRFKGRASGKWELECCRCLKHQDFSYNAAVEGTLPQSQEPFDAAEEVRQALVLALPMKAYCKPDCRGLCLKCRGDKNTGDCACGPQTSF